MKENQVKKERKEDLICEKGEGRARRFRKGVNKYNGCNKQQLKQSIRSWSPFSIPHPRFHKFRFGCPCINSFPLSIPLIPRRNTKKKKDVRGEHIPKAHTPSPPKGLHSSLPIQIAERVTSSKNGKQERGRCESERRMKNPRYGVQVDILCYVGNQQVYSQRANRPITGSGVPSEMPEIAQADPRYAQPECERKKIPKSAGHAARRTVPVG